MRNERCRDMPITRMRYLSRLFGLLSNESRLGLLLYLRDGTPRTGGEISEFTGINRSNVSKVCRDMEEMGLLHRTKLGAFAQYTIDRICVDDLRDWLLKLMGPESEGTGWTVGGEVTT